MQTFLPHADFIDTVKCLDYRRLGKQRVEAYQILKANCLGGRWAAHPAAKMWRGYETALGIYMDFCIEEWIHRGYKNTMLRSHDLEFLNSDTKILYPPWLGDNSFHAAHRAALLHKDREYYSKFNWREEPKIDYIWPKIEQENNEHTK